MEITLIIEQIADFAKSLDSGSPLLEISRLLRGGEVYLGDRSVGFQRGLEDIEIPGIASAARALPDGDLTADFGNRSGAGDRSGIIWFNR